jgi:hypothetical protein
MGITAFSCQSPNGEWSCGSADSGETAGVFVRLLVTS